jgi:cAMP-dependent protein kinase regulator
VADALVPEDCIPYHTIVREGDEGDTFYILESGSAEAFKDDKIVQSYSQSGDYFGELALLRDEPRAATVKAGDSGCRVLKLNRSAFTRLLGDLEELSQKVYE